MTNPRELDYLVIGGGTAGAVVAARLAERPDVTVGLIEAGPSDEGVPGILELRRWPGLLGGDYDYDYRIEPQPRGNGRIRHSRGRMLGGCSSHNSAIAFVPPAFDFARWEAAGATGWDPDGVAPFFERVRARVNLEASDSGNALVAAFIEAAVAAGIPRADFGAPPSEGVDWFRLNKRGPMRASSSVAYLHPLARAPRGLVVITGCPVARILIERGRAIGVDTAQGVYRARREVIVSCGAFDTPRLLMLSGVGPADHLREHGIDVVADLPGVGAHLLDHPEGVVIYESARPVPEETAQLYEAGLFYRTDPALPVADVMLHFGTEAFDMWTAPSGYPTAEHAFSFTPNVTRARSQGTVRLRSAAPADPPRIDFAYFTDPDGYDERTMVAGIELARRIARQAPLAPWVRRELAPGPDVQGFEALSRYARTTANTVYHPAGTCKLGADRDPAAVVDPALRVRGVSGLRVADASVFPEMVSVNPCLTCMMIGERCADLLRREG